jgi:hypothetical protein
MVNTYACKKAINPSRNIIAVTITHGNIPINTYIDPNVIKLHENPIRIFNNACPDIIFANNRILKLNTFAIYDTNSIPIKNVAIINGTPLGKNKFVIFHLCLYIPIIFIPTK